MNDSRIIQDSNDMCQVLDMRKKGIKPRTFRATSCNPIDEICGGGDAININMIINIIPNSFVLSYLAALQCVLSNHFKPSLDTTVDKSATITILFMGDAVISKGGAWESNFIDHYKRITIKCKDTGKDGLKTRRTLMKLKRSEFESFLNMVLHSFDEPCIKKAVRKGKIKLQFDNLSNHREKLNIAEGDSSKNKIRIDEFKEVEFSKDLPDVQRSMFFNGGNRAVILEVERLLNRWRTHIKDGERFVFITAEVFKQAIEAFNGDLWNNIKSNTFWFNDPPIRPGKMLMYLNTLSNYVNEANKIKYIELEEFYHYYVLKDLRSTLFEHHLDEMQNMFRSTMGDYDGKINALTVGDDYAFFKQLVDTSTHSNKVSKYLIDHMQDKTYLEYNILQLRSHQMEVMNKGFLSVQDEIIKQLDLVL